MQLLIFFKFLDRETLLFEWEPNYNTISKKESQAFFEKICKFFLIFLKNYNFCFFAVLRPYIII